MLTTEEREPVEALSPLGFMIPADTRGIHSHTTVVLNIRPLPGVNPSKAKHNA